MLKHGVVWLSLSHRLQNPRKSGQIPDKRPVEKIHPNQKILSLFSKKKTDQILCLLVKMGKKCEFKSTSFHTLHPCHLLPISTEILGNFQLNIVNVEELFNRHTDFFGNRL